MAGRRRPTAKQSRASRRNITRAHVANIRRTRPRSIGRIRPLRKIVIGGR